MYKVKARERWLLSNSIHSAWTPFCNGQGLPNLTIPNAIYCNIPQCSGPPVPLSLLWHTIDWDLFLLSSKFHIKSFTSWLYCLNNDVGMIKKKHHSDIVNLWGCHYFDYIYFAPKTEVKQASFSKVGLSVLKYWGIIHLYHVLKTG